MKKDILIGEVSIPLDSYAISGTALLGTKGAGKTWAAKGIAEQLLDHGVPIVVFDPIGRWHYMKVAGRAKDGRGFKVVVAGGRAADLPLTPQSAPELVRAAIRENIPLVIDMFDKNLSKGDWRRIVQSCFRTLLFENEGVRHIFLEETAEFAPQKVLDGATYAEVEKLVRMGGNASLGVTLINQRAQEVNKAVLDLCDNLVLMRQRGSHAIDALEKWIDKLDPNSAKAITRAMPTMQAGEAWVFTGSAEAASHVHTGPIHSFHPDRQHPEVSGRASSADTSEFVQKMTAMLPAIAAEAEANDPAVLKKRIRELEKKIADIPVVDAEYVDTKAIEAAAEQRGRVAGIQSAVRAYQAQRKSFAGEMHRVITESLQKFDGEPEGLSYDVPVTSWSKASPPTVADRKRLENLEHARAVRSVRSHTGAPLRNGTKFTKAERLILTALAQYRDGRTKTQVAILTGYASGGGGFNNALSALRGRSYIADHGEKLLITPAGDTELGDFEPLPHGDRLLQHWLGRLGKAERAALEVLAGVHPRALTKEELAGRAGYEANGGGFNNALSRLRTLELIEGRGELKASEDLFG